MASTSKIDLVIQRLDRIESNQKDQGEKLYDIHGKVSKLEVRASIFGVLGGLIVAALARFGPHFGSSIVAAIHKFGPFS